MTDVAFFRLSVSLPKDSQLFSWLCDLIQLKLCFKQVDKEIYYLRYKELTRDDKKQTKDGEWGVG